jgi:hypothetical protein
MVAKIARILFKIIGKILHVALAIVVFLVAVSVSSAVTMVVANRAGGRVLGGYTHFVFTRDIPRGTRLEVKDLDDEWLPKEDTTTSVPRWRPECVVGKQLLVDVKADDLVAPSLVAGGGACVASAPPEEWLRD